MAKKKSMTLQGELFWEYRAKYAEWEKTFSDIRLVEELLKIEKAKPEYKRIFDLIDQEVLLRDVVRSDGAFLMDVQKRVAKSIGLSLDEFLSKCVIDHETGVMRIID